MPRILIAQNKLSLNCLTYRYLMFLLVNVLIINTGYTKVISFIGFLFVWFGFVCLFFVFLSFRAGI